MSYIGNQPVLNTSEFREEFSVTSTQTVFNTSGFVTNTNSEFLEVYRNGVLLSKDDYTLDSDAATITLVNAAVAGDIVVVTGRRDITKRQTERIESIDESGEPCKQRGTEIKRDSERHDQTYVEVHICAYTNKDDMTIEMER